MTMTMTPEQQQAIVARERAWVEDQFARDLDKLTDAVPRQP